MNKNKTKTLQADAELVKEIEKISIDNNVTRKKLIDEILYDYIKNKKGDKIEKM